MPFPSSISASPSLEDALTQLTSYAGAIKSRTTSLIAASEDGDVDGGVIVNYLRDLVLAKTRLDAVSGTSGLAAYAQAQYNSPGLDIVAEYTAMSAAITATVSWIQANFPKDGSGYLLYEKIEANGTMSYRLFTTAALATFRTQLSALAATIA